MTEAVHQLRLPDDCRREVRRLYEYWDGKRRGRPSPTRDDIEVTDIPGLLRHIFLIDVLPDQILRYRVFGTALAELFKRDLTGLEVGVGLQPGQVSEVLRRYRRILRDGRPFYHRDRMHEIANDFTEIERLILPLSNGEGGISHLFGMTIPLAVRP